MTERLSISCEAGPQKQDEIGSFTHPKGGVPKQRAIPHRQFDHDLNSLSRVYVTLRYFKRFRLNPEL